MDTLCFPTDFSEPARHAFDTACRWAKAFDAALHLVHIVEYGALPVEEAAERLSDLVGEARARGVDDVTKTLQSAEAAAPAILDVARDAKADLIVMGTHGRRRLERLFMGSVAEEVIQEAPCPVLAMRRRGEASKRGLRRLLVPVDFSEPSERCAALAGTVAGHLGGEVHLLHVLEEIDLPGIYGALDNPLNEVRPDLEERVRDELRALARKHAADVRTEVHFAEGDAAGTIVSWAEEQTADLIVIGSQGRSGLERFLLGSVSEKVVRRAACPVLISK